MHKYNQYDIKQVVVGHISTGWALLFLLCHRGVIYSLPYECESSSFFLILLYWKLSWHSGPVFPCFPFKAFPANTKDLCLLISSYAPLPTTLWIHLQSYSSLTSKTHLEAPSPDWLNSSTVHPCSGMGGLMLLFQLLVLGEMLELSVRLLTIYR